MGRKMVLSVGQLSLAVPESSSKVGWTYRPNLILRTARLTRPYVAHDSGLPRRSELESLRKTINDPPC